MTAQSKTLEELVTAFYNKEKSLKKPIGEILFKILREELSETFTIKDSENANDKLRGYIKEELEKYFEEDNHIIPCISQEIDSFSRNMRNWVTDSYKGDYGKYTKDIDRACILTIAFVLGLSHNSCDKLLKAVNQHPLHRGDISENIIIHCLKNQKDFSVAISLYKCFKHLCETHSIYLTENTVSFIERSKYIKDNLQLTKISNNEIEYEISQELKDEVQKWEKINYGRTYFDDRDIRALDKMLSLQNYFSLVSKKTLATMATICEDDKTNNKKSRAFFKKMFTKSSREASVICKRSEKDLRKALVAFNEEFGLLDNILILHDNLFKTIDEQTTNTITNYKEEIIKLSESIQKEFENIDPLISQKIQDKKEQNKLFSKLSKLQEIYDIIAEEKSDSFTKENNNIYVIYKKTKNSKSSNSLSNIFGDFKKALQEEKNSNPTRAFVLAMGIVSWCCKEDEISLKEYINSLLAPESSDFHLLDDDYEEDRFVLELNRFRFSKAKRITYYIDDNQNEFLIIFPERQNFALKSEVFQVIIQHYLKENKSFDKPFRDSRHFFDFDYFIEKAETKSECLNN